MIPGAGGTRRGRCVDPRWIAPTALFFILGWLLTFNGAYVNGDEVLSLAKLEIRNAFAPNFKREWVPNRMLDAYVRDLLAAGFDLWFFSLRSVVPVDFFLLFKAYVATVHATFLTVVLCYLRRATSDTGSKVGAVEDAVAWCFLAVVVLALFPWRNQTHLVAYQLAAFLCFVLLNEITRLLVAVVQRKADEEAGGSTSAGEPHAGLILLSFICAFSLEAYAAIVSICLLLPAGLTMRAILRARRTSRHDDDTQRRLLPIALLMLAAITFCAIAIVVTLASSQRADVVLTDRELVLSGLGDSGVAWLTSRRGIIAILLCAIPVGIAALLRWRARGDGAPLSGALSTSGKRGRDPLTWIHASALAIVVISTGVVTALVSIKANVDYFSHSSYPWGAFLLIAKLFATCTVVLLALRMSRRDLALRSAVLLLAFIAASKVSLDALGSTYASHQTSQKLHRIYDALANAHGGVIDSGLDLASMPMQERPLPTVDSPAWFAAAFARFFEKYYGVSGGVLFR